MPIWKQFARRNNPNLLREDILISYGLQHCTRTTNGNMLAFGIFALLRFLNWINIQPNKFVYRLEFFIFYCNVWVFSSGGFLLSSGSNIPTENQHQHTSPTATTDLQIFHSLNFQLYDLYTTTFSPTEASLRKELIGFKATTGIFIILCAATLTCAGTLLYLHAIYKRNRPVSVHYN
ncbi:hypothetical protein T06_7837 [Trichinella sp. T6]|nr:hypothetical protein T06_7837 [Trichinella sp. T6]